MDIVLLCDFDGTILDIDTLRFLLGKFSKSNWRTIIKQFEQGELTLEECLNILWSKIHIPKPVMLKELENVAKIRSNFKTLLTFCGVHNIPFIIISSGLDFIIHHFLNLTGYKNAIKCVSLTTKYQDNQIMITFPKLLDNTSTDFKEDLVKDYKRKGYHVVFIGDGISDYKAALNAAFSFTIKDSELNLFCKKRRIPHQEITNFQDVIDVLKDFLLSNCEEQSN
jgi:2,3-diketo-5-methylthio-1-phosphopentane phosphatase